MANFIWAAAFLVLIASALAAPLIATKQGTTWQYDVTDKAGGESTSTQLQIRYCIVGTQQFGRNEVLKLETFVGNAATKTELMTIDQNGILSFAHTGKDGKMIGFISPQTVVPAKLNEGATWDYVDEIAGLRVHQHFTVANTEKVSVPAGDFRAFRLHCQESVPISVMIDRWFVPGIGFVKEIATLRSPTGNLLNRRTLELARLPTTETKANDVAKKLLVGVSSRPIGEFETEFPSTVQNIYARWEGHGLRKGAKVRAVWIAENVGNIAPANYKIDDAVAIAEAPDSHGVLTLSRPDPGWAEGNYRVEFYLDETLIETVKIRIK